MYKTLYNYIEMELFPNLTAVAREVRPPKQARRVRRSYRNVDGKYGTVKGGQRSEIGHWEMDCIGF